MFEIMIVIDAAAEVGLETKLRIQDMIWCMEREERGGDLMKKWLKIMQPQITGRTTLDSDANPIPNIEILLQKHSELLLPFLIFHLALQIVTYPDFISNNFSLIATINQDTIFSQVQNVNIQRPYISDHLVE